MAKITVNHRVLRDVADQIDKYCKTQDKEMRKADQAVKGMAGQSWVGMDADAFVGKWDDVDGRDSTAVKFKDNLKKYADVLRACAEEYQTAQEDSYDEASRLPKYLAW